MMVMLSFLKRLFGLSETPQKDHRGHDLKPDEKTVSERLKIVKASKHSGVRRAPIDMAQGD
jgi:hypothetical protein